MEKNIEQKYFLAMQAMPGDYAYIDVSKLKIANGFIPYSLSDIDSFTVSFTYDEIVNDIKEANIVSSKYLNGKLVITDNQKHKPLEVLTKDIYNNFDLYLFLSENFDNKNLINTICTKYSAFVKDVPLSKLFKNSSSVEMANMIFKMPYLEQRKLMFYILDKHNSLPAKNKRKELVRDKAA